MGDIKHTRESVFMASDEVIEFACQPCRRERKTVESDKFCVDCGEYMCLSCLTHHSKFQSMSRHIIRDVKVAKLKHDSADETKSVNSLLVPTPTITCVEHKGKIVDMVCLDHSTVCCSACIAIEHRSCKDVEYIPNLCKQLDVDMLEKSTVCCLQDIENGLRQVLAERNKETYDTEEKIMLLVEAHIENVRQMFNARLDDMKKELQKYADETFKSLSSGPSNVTDRTIEDSMKTLCSLLERLNNHKNNKADTFVAVGQAQADTEQANNILDTIRNTTTQTVEFQPNDDLIKWINQFQSLGKIKIVDVGPKMSDTTMSREKKQHSKPGLFRTLISQSSIKKKTGGLSLANPIDINVRVAKEQTCDIVGACHLPSGDILISDCNNCTVKRLDDRLKITEILKVGAIPWHICVVDDETCALALWNQKRVQMLAHKNEMVLKSAFSVGLRCSGIACLDNTLYVACGGMKVNFNTRGRVEVYTIKGELTRVFVDPFKGPYQISNDTYGHGLLVADSSIEGVVKINKEVTGLIECPAMSDLHGVVSIGPEKLIVCGYGSHNVALVETGKDNIELLSSKDGLRKPQMLCYDRSKRKLIIGLESMNTLRVYDVIL